MAKTNFLEKTFNFFGENPNGAIYVAVAIAAFKGVFRPIFTMSDKKSDPQTKKYTAIREALTELIAIPVYIAVPTVFGKLAVKAYEKKAQGAVKEVTKKAIGTNVKFWGVLASTAIIPALCNVIQPKIMASIKKKSEAKKALTENNNIATVGNTNKTSFNGAYPIQIRKSYNSGMRVGS